MAPGLSKNSDRVAQKHMSVIVAVGRWFAVRILVVASIALSFPLRPIGRARRSNAIFSLEAL